MGATTLKVNGRSHTLDIDPETPLLYALSDDLSCGARNSDAGSVNAALAP